MAQEFPHCIRIGTRKSKLALAQAETVRGRLAARWPELAAEGRLELVPVMTTGDRITDRSLADIGGKGLFAKELDEALLSGDIHFAVHSVKDMESFISSEISLVSTLEREDNRDAFLSRSGMGFMALQAGSRVGTASVRRAAQLLAVRSDLHMVPLRGNVPTRIEKLKSGEVDGMFLALAGLRRLGLEAEATAICDRDLFLPAAGQGAIGIVCRSGDSAMHALLAPLNHAETYHAVTAERTMLAVLDGSCHTPIAAWARMEGDALRLSGAIYAADGSECRRAERRGSPQDATALGRDAGEELRAIGGHLLP